MRQQVLDSYLATITINKGNSARKAIEILYEAVIVDPSWDWDLFLEQLSPHIEALDLLNLVSLATLSGHCESKARTVLLERIKKAVRKNPHLLDRILRNVEAIK